jgi:hypothetical protein
MYTTGVLFLAFLCDSIVTSKMIENELCLLKEIQKWFLTHICRCTVRLSNFHHYVGTLLSTWGLGPRLESQPNHYEMPVPRSFTISATAFAGARFGMESAQLAPSRRTTAAAIPMPEILILRRIRDRDKSVKDEETKKVKGFKT